MSKHTPGPWRLDEGGSIQAMFEGEWVQVASISPARWFGPHKGKNARFREQMPSNAHLIAAAPELLEALEMIYAGHSASTLHEMTRLYGEGILRADRAIAKARGEEAEDG